jgi:RNA polymerase sigma-70 factor, ECF subfamily
MVRRGFCGTESRSGRGSAIAAASPPVHLAYTPPVSQSPVSPSAPAATPLTEADAQELALVRRIQSGDQGAWTPLLTRYQDRLFGVCVKMLGNRDLAADVTQDAMVKIIEGLGSYDGRAKLSTWMIRVTMNVCLSKLRSEKLRRHLSLEALNSVGGSGKGGATGYYEDRRSGSDSLVDQKGTELAGQQSVEREETRRRVAAALLRVSPEQRAILVLRDSRGLDYEQIAEVLNVPVGTVKSRLFRARAALRDALENLDRRR